MQGTYYTPYKQGTLNKSQARIMAAVGEKAYLRQICERSGYYFAGAASLVNGLVEAEILQATNV
jgi:hypothetical protein